MDDRPCCGDVPDNVLDPPRPYRWGRREELAVLPTDETSAIDASADRGWRCWWSDGETVRAFDSRVSSWDDVPNEGVQVVVVYEHAEWTSGKPYRRLFYESDLYVMGGKAKRGTLIPDILIDHIMTEALASESW